MAKSRQGIFSNLGRRIHELVDEVMGSVEETTRTVKFESVHYGNGPSIRGEGPVVSEVRSVAPFDRVRSSLMGDVVVRVGEPRRVEVFAQANLLEHVDTTVRDGELVIGMHAGSYSSTGEMRVEISVPSLSALHLTGHGNTKATKVNSTYFLLRHTGMGDVTVQGTARTVDLHLTGHGDVVFEGIVADDVDLLHSGMGDVRLVGSTANMILKGSGHGDLELAELMAGDVELTHSGMGDLDLCANGKVLGFASGHGDISVRGNASWRVRHTGMGDVDFR